jgi:Phosphodiester glycosidase
MRSRIASVAALIVASVPGALAVGSAPDAATAAELPLGSRSLDERRERATVAPGVRWTSIVREGGPWRVNVLAIDRTALDGRLGGVLANERIAGLERPSAMARRTGAAVGMNGGFFAVDGDPVGALAIDGRLLSDPVRGRSALLVPSDPARPPRVERLRFAGAVTAGAAGATRILDGVERRRGIIPACGGRGGDLPTERPNSALTCADGSELVLISDRFGATRARGGLEAELRGGVVVRVGSPGRTAVAPGSQVLSASGDAARFLRDAVLPRSSPLVDLSVLAAGAPVPLAEHALVVGGGPRLLRRGRVSVTARPEGFAPLEAPAFYGSFVASRQPRTLAGVRRDGSLLLVTVDGRRPGWSAGVTLTEAARVMRSLGARDALNLDGGGSTAMVVRGVVVNRPSDPSGERPVSDGVFVLP